MGSGVTRTGDQVRGHLVDRKGIYRFQEVGTWLGEGTEGQNVTALILYF